MVFDRLKSLFATKGLDAIGDEPMRVRAEGRIENDNELQSPLTGLRAVLFSWRLVTRHQERREWGNRAEFEHEVFQTVGYALKGSDLSIATERGTLLVAFEGLDFWPPTRVEGVVSLDEPPPIPELVEPFHQAKYPVSIQEATLCKGDLVRVNAHIERLRRGQDLGAYRTKSGRMPDFRTRRDLGPVQLLDLSLRDV